MSALGMAFLGLIVTVVSTLVTIHFRRKEERRAHAREIREQQLHIARMSQMMGEDWKTKLQGGWDE